MDRGHIVPQMAYLVSGLNGAQVLEVSLQKEFSERHMIGKKGIYLERNGLHRVWTISEDSSLKIRCG